MGASQLADRRTELAEVRALVAATEPASPEHATFLDYLNALCETLEGIYVDHIGSRGDVYK